ncbi:MAG: DUF4131 domain-containing protein, partial [Dongiaceae bacterium]
IVLRNRPLPAMAAICLSLAFLGFSAAQLGVAIVSAPAVAREIDRAVVQGRACEVTLLPNGYRVYVDHIAIEGIAPEAMPRRIRLRVAGQTAAEHVGQWVQLTAAVGPISPPVAPGAFDFQRDVFFERIGAVALPLARRSPLPRDIRSGSLPLCRAVCRRSVWTSPTESGRCCRAIPAVSASP